MSSNCKYLHICKFHVFSRCTNNLCKYHHVDICKQFCGRCFDCAKHHIKLPIKSRSRFHKTGLPRGHLNSANPTKYFLYHHSHTRKPTSHPVLSNRVSIQRISPPPYPLPYPLPSFSEINPPTSLAAFQHFPTLPSIIPHHLRAHSTWTLRTISLQN